MARKKSSPPRAKDVVVDKQTIAPASFHHWIAMVIYQIVFMVFIEPLMMILCWKTTFAPVRSAHTDARGYAIVLPDVHAFNYLRNYNEVCIRNAFSARYSPIDANAPTDVQYIHTVDMDALAAAIVPHIIAPFVDEPGRPLLVVGIGLGGVLACHIEKKLRGVDAISRVDVVTIAAPLTGTFWGQFAPGILTRQMGAHMAAVCDPKNTRRLPDQLFPYPSSVHYHHVYSATDTTVLPCCSAVLFNGDVLRLDRIPHRYVATDRRTLDLIAGLGNTETVQ